METKYIQEDSEKEYLKITDLDNYFKVFEDKRGNYVYDMNQTIYLDFNEGDLPEYTIKTPSFWTLVSYNLYGTTRLAWLLMKVNNITPKNVFRRLEPGETIKYVDNSTVQTIVRTMNGYES